MYHKHAATARMLSVSVYRGWPNTRAWRNLQSRALLAFGMLSSQPHAHHILAAYNHRRVATMHAGKHTLPYSLPRCTGDQYMPIESQFTERRPRFPLLSERFFSVNWVYSHKLGRYHLFAIIRSLVYVNSTSVVSVQSSVALIVWGVGTPLPRFHAEHNRSL